MEKMVLKNEVFFPFNQMAPGVWTLGPLKLRQDTCVSSFAVIGTGGKGGQHTLLKDLYTNGNRSFSQLATSNGEISCFSVQKKDVFYWFYSVCL